uniref:(California timema) hypothetical protein n=1 Tax=Timema californicum TaxID=61474 RepID=A0A7R9IWI1_TIMCA|nr:unnamed protein product [Timema californicum]
MANDVPERIDGECLLVYLHHLDTDDVPERIYDDVPEKQASVCSRLKSRLKRSKLNEWLLVSALVLILITVSLLTTLLGDKDGDSNPMEVPRSTDLEEHWYVSREKWQANQPSSQWITFNATQTCVIISDTATRPCTDLSDCTTLVKEIQESHMKDYNYSDIDYSFLVGGDGRIYEGWGWENRGTHTKSCCFNCLEVAFIGSYLNEGDRQEVTKEQLKYFQKLLEIGVALSSLTRDFKILAQCRKTNTKHLGPNLVQAVKNLQHFEENIIRNILRDYCVGLHSPGEAIRQTVGACNGDIDEVIMMRTVSVAPFSRPSSPVPFDGPFLHNLPIMMQPGLPQDSWIQLWPLGPFELEDPDLDHSSTEVDNAATINLAWYNFWVAQ